MTYIINAIVAEDGLRHPLRRGQIHADLDDPEEVMIALPATVVAGTRYLVTSLDADDYKSSMSLVDVPARVDQKAYVSASPGQLEDFEAILAALFARSRSRVLVVYLEANRIISRPPAADDAQPDVHVVRHHSFEDFIDAVRTHHVLEEEVHFVQAPASGKQ